MIQRQALLWSVLILVLCLWKMNTRNQLSAVCLKAHTAVEQFMSLEGDDLVTRTQARVKHSLGVLETMLDQFSVDEVAVSYNGGKDCLVMLVLYLSVLHTRFTESELNKLSQINAVMINYEQQFPELVNFIAKSSSQYNLHLDQYNSTLKEGFEQYLDQHPQTKAIVVGTRRTDPYALTLQDIQRTDSGWPDFVRVHPVVDWSYDEIWCFLRTAHVEYCELYDKGFTSLGGVDTTVENPQLSHGDGFKPAYLLEDGDVYERHGRVKRM